ncbi:hypothetical protein GCM10023238_08690 [Streptomyces heliomycini]
MRIEVDECAVVVGKLLLPQHAADAQAGADNGSAGSPGTTAWQPRVTMCSLLPGWWAGSARASATSE